MTWLDWLIVAVIVYGTVCGMQRGLVLSLFSLLGLVAAVILGWHYASVVVSFFETQWEWHSRLTAYLMETVDIPQHAGGVISPDATHAELAEGLLTVIAFLLLFGIVVNLARALGHVLHTAIGWGLTAAVDRVMGGLLGLCATTVASAVALGVLLITSASVPALQLVAEIIHQSAVGSELVRVLYGLSPLSDILFKWLS